MLSYGCWRERECAFFYYFNLFSSVDCWFFSVDAFAPLDAGAFTSCPFLSFCNLVQLKWLFDICLYRLILFKKERKKQPNSHLFRRPFVFFYTFFPSANIPCVLRLLLLCGLIYRAFFRFSILTSLLISFLCVLYCNYYDCYAFSSIYTHSSFKSVRFRFQLYISNGVRLFRFYFVGGGVVRFSLAFMPLSLCYYYAIILFYLLLCWITEKFVI